MAGEAEAVEAVKAVHRRVGSGGPADLSKATRRADLEAAVGRGVQRAVLQLAAKAARPAPVDQERQWRGDGGDTLRKAWWDAPVTDADRTRHDAARDRAKPDAVEDDVLALVKGAHAGGGRPEGPRLAKRAPTRAFVKSVDDAANRLADARAAGGDISAARIAEQRRLADALVEMPAERAPFTLPGDESPEQVAAEAGAAELEAAARDAAAGAPGWIDRLAMAGLAKAYLRDRRRVHPHSAGRVG